MNFATLDDVKNTNDPVITTEDYDEILTVIMEGVGETFSKKCNRLFVANTYTELLTGGGDYVFLRETPIRQINNIWVDWEALWNDSAIINPADYLLVNSETGQIWSMYFTVRPLYYSSPTIKIEYEGGYDPVEVIDGDYPIPGDLKLAFIRQTQYDLKRRKDMGISTVTFKDGNVIKQPIVELLPQVEAVLQRYRVANI